MGSKSKSHGLEKACEGVVTGGSRVAGCRCRKEGKREYKGAKEEGTGEGKWKMLGLEGLQRGVMRGVLGVWDW